ncbi:PREDICTED: craniofacial development protein 2-like [Nicotiana attenuata]|uniref:craniofacial development protein 2-like n=1 Tax=Nicotiana attenuata TaxID=49451 RepID=UPI000905153A|nr:PREDICTED: craniofacial development protein 2-like [Nicotiana attenuata]
MKTLFLKSSNRHYLSALQSIPGVTVSHSQKWRDFNGHIGSTTGGYGEMHGGFGYGDRNGGGTSLLDFAKAFEMVIANSSFSKREEHLITFQSVVAKTQIDYLSLRRCDTGLCKDCKVIPGKTLATQHRLLDIGIRVKGKKRETAREVLGVSKGYSGGHKGDWWWDEVVQGKVEAKKAA